MEHSRGRTDFHQPNLNRLEDATLCAFPEEIEYANPKMNKSEEIFIFGSNYLDKTTIEVALKRKPLPKNSINDEMKDQVSVKVQLDDGKGNVYCLNESTIVNFRSNEYYGCGLAIESLQANKTTRIKFRGYLNRFSSDNPKQMVNHSDHDFANEVNAKLVYVRFRFLCLSIAKTFDYGREISKKFLSNEMRDEFTGSFANILENRFEQHCHIKGTFKVEDFDDNIEMAFSGTIERRFQPNLNSFGPRYVSRINGFTCKGLKFQIGVVTSSSFQYRYGMMTDRFINPRSLKYLSISPQLLETYVLKANKIPCLSFDCKFVENGDKLMKFDLKPYKGNVHSITIDGVDGFAFVNHHKYDDQNEQNEPRIVTNQMLRTNLILVIKFQDIDVNFMEMAGGKGATLSQLWKICSTNNKKLDWSIPNGIIVTTEAFRLQLYSIETFPVKIEKLKKSVCGSKRATIDMICNEFVDWFANQPLLKMVQDEIEIKLVEQFGHTWNEKCKFAIRSSTMIEDSMEMSAAGQMSSYLGISGLPQIVSAVVKCWASQFSFVSIEYKRTYGQDLCSPMAVIIQEMIDGDAAGVIFTAHPFDGDERKMIINSNFGLGDSVVASYADPDTFELEVDIRANSYQIPRHVRRIGNREIGKKLLTTRIRNCIEDVVKIEDFVMQQQWLNGRSEPSIDDSTVLRLGTIALLIQQVQNSIRDIEWTIKDGKIYILQSRPITNLDSGFIDYELEHELDSPSFTEFELYSRAHWGENYPGAISWIPILMRLYPYRFGKLMVRFGLIHLQDYNPYRPSIGIVSNQVMLNISSGSISFMFRDYPKSSLSRALVIAIFGRHIDDNDFNEHIRNISEDILRNITFKKKLVQSFILSSLLFVWPKELSKIEKMFFDKDSQAFDFEAKISNIPLCDKLSKLYEISNQNLQFLDLHGALSFGSSIKTFILMQLLKSSSDVTNVDSDYNMMLSHCNTLVSAEVPDQLRNIAKVLVDKKRFVQMSDVEALSALQNKRLEPIAAQAFEEFLARHGHRGYRELDFMHQPWGMDPLPCVQAIQSMLKNDTSLESKQVKSIEQIMFEMKTPLPKWKLYLIKRFILPWVQESVGLRERSKSIIIKWHDMFRKALWHIAATMVNEGLIPEQDIFFYLTFDEIQRIIRREQCPILLMKARQRKRLYPYMDKLKFDEFLRGFHMKPRELSEENNELKNDSFTLHGTAITIGCVEGRVFVAESIKDSINIKQDDILVTYSTDIGWSPYYPLLSGIVTEIGGTISHGAVIAREYGIPCLISVENACAYFRTGDMARLDTKNGTITKILSK